MSITIRSRRFWQREEFPEIFLLTTPTDEVLYRKRAVSHELLEQKGIAHRYREYTSAGADARTRISRDRPGISGVGTGESMRYWTDFLELITRKRETQ